MPVVCFTEKEQTAPLSNVEQVGMRLSVRSDRGADANSATTFNSTSLFLAHATPDAGVLTRLERPLETLVNGGTTPADRFGLLNLQ